LLLFFFVHDGLPLLRRDNFLAPLLFPKSRKEINHTARPTCYPLDGGGFSPRAKSDTVTDG
jgi:hypothetical protein